MQKELIIVIEPKLKMLAAAWGLTKIQGTKQSESEIKARPLTNTSAK